MSIPRGSGKVQLNVAIRPEVKTLIAALAAERGTRQVEVVELAIRKLAEDRP